jgi:ABC-2 type transport system permease protein
VTNVIASELFKLRTTRTFYGLVGGVLALVLVIVVLILALSSESSPLHDVIGIIALVQAIALILGILTVTSEFRHGTITPTLLVVPERTRLMLAKLIAAALAGLVLGLAVSVLITVLVAVFGEDTGGAWKLIVGATLATALYSVFGVGLGALVRNQVGAIIGALVYLLVLEGLLTLIPHMDKVVSRYGLNGSRDGLNGAMQGGDVLHQVPAGFVLLGWCALFVAAGLALMRRRDITA